MQTTLSNIKYAGFWRRLLALAIDAVLFFMVTAPLLFLIYGRNYFDSTLADTSPVLFHGVFDFLISKVLAVVLLVVFWHVMAATPGKQLLGLKVVDASSLQPVSWTQAFVRIVGYLLSMIILYLGFIWAAFDKRKQGWHDKLAKTVVIHDEDDYSHMSLPQLMQQLDVK